MHSPASRFFQSSTASCWRFPGPSLRAVSEDDLLVRIDRCKASGFFGAIHRCAVEIVRKRVAAERFLLTWIQRVHPIPFSELGGCRGLFRTGRACIVHRLGKSSRDRFPESIHSPRPNDPTTTKFVSSEANLSPNSRFSRPRRSRLFLFSASSCAFRMFRQSHPREDAHLKIGRGSLSAMSDAD